MDSWSRAVLDPELSRKVSFIFLMFIVCIFASFDFEFRFPVLYAFDEHQSLFPKPWDYIARTPVHFLPDYFRRFTSWQKGISGVWNFYPFQKWPFFLCRNHRNILLQFTRDRGTAISSWICQAARSTTYAISVRGWRVTLKQQRVMSTQRCIFLAYECPLFDLGSTLTCIFLFRS